MCDLVLFVERTGELRLCSKVKDEMSEAVAKASLNRAKVTRGRPETR